MKKIRQGNTIVVRWNIKTNGEDVSLEGRDLRLYAQSGFYRLEVKNWVVDGCELTFKIEGKALNQCGRYDLTLIENGGRENQAVLDACNAFEVVAKSCMAGGDDNDGLSIESLELTGDLSHATIGEFYDLITANSKAITEEINRATIAENSIAEALVEEKGRALEAERKLQEGVDETKEKVDAFLADADTSEAAIDKLKELQDYIKEDKSGAAMMLESITSNQRAINAEEKRATQAEADLEKKKANKTGYYQEMSVGVADNLAGRDEAIEREFVFDQSGGAYNNILEEDTARIESIQGNTLVYNQLIDYSEQTNIKPNQSDVIITNSSISVTSTYNATDSKYWFGVGVYIDIVSSHKYLIQGNLTSMPTNTTLQLSKIANVSIANKTGHFSALIAPDTTQTNYEIFYLNCISRSFVIGDAFNIDGLKFYDLTKMFGAGYEPTTAEEAERIIDQLNVEDGYNEGQIINNNTTAIKTVGLNIVNTSGEILVAPRSLPSNPKTWAEVGKIYKGVNSDGYTEGYTQAVRNDDGSFTVTNDGGNYGLCFFCKVLPNTTYTSRNTYVSPKFPRASFYDKNKLFLSSTNIINNTFTTPYNCEYIFLVLFTLDGNVISTNTFENPVIHLKNTGYMDGKYTPYPAYREETKQLPTIEGGLRSVGDVCDEIRYNHNTKRWEYIKRIEERAYQAGDESNADVLTDGTSTYIKAETQTITELDSELSPDYKVWDWGTEEAIQVTPSAPFKASIKYGFNAVDQIRGNKLRIEELSKTSVTEEKLQLSTKAITDAYPSGDPMHEAYVAAGAVWNDATKTWSANGRSGLSNSDVRSLYNKADMDELLFRKLWNKACLYTNDNSFYMGRYNEATGFYELNGVWDLTYDEALASYSFIGNDLRLTASSISQALRNSKLRTTLPRGSYGLTIGISQPTAIQDVRFSLYSATNEGLVFVVGYTANLTIGYTSYLRVVRTPINCCESRGQHSYDTIMNNETLKHVMIYKFYNMKLICTGNPYISYFSIHYMITNAVKRNGLTIQLDTDTYNLINGTASPDDYSKEPLYIDSLSGTIIPYDKNSKVMPPNTFWREELDTKGINGEYIYPSFAEYLANNPQNFATAEEWQALATLAEEKGITLTT